MNLKWIDECIGDRKSWVLRDLDDGGRPMASVVLFWYLSGSLPRHSLTVSGIANVGSYDTLEEAQAVGAMLAPLPYKEKAAYKTVINRMN